jgi:hypothetical protein
MISGDLEKTTEEVQKVDVVGSKADASKADKGNTDSLQSARVIEIESRSTSISHSTSSTSSDLDDVPLGRI